MNSGCELWLDCEAGVAGDMLAAALLDLADDAADAERVVREALESLPVQGFAVDVRRVAKAGISCCDFHVILDRDHENHDHDMKYLHGDQSDLHGDQSDPHEAGKRHDGECESHEGGHHHGHHHHHDSHGDHAQSHHHEHRGLQEIEHVIDHANLTDSARALAKRAFRILAAAEAAAHGLPIDEVHFHEVGAVDSIVDIVAVSVLIDYLGVNRTIVPVLVDGRGTVRCQHGVMPVPVPATINICRNHGLPLRMCEVDGELVTPTGAALVAALSPEFELPPRFTVVRVGLGAGKREYARPSIIRSVLIESFGAEGDESSLSDEVRAPTRVIKIECDLDDMPGEELGYVAELLRDARAREVHWLPLYTKKGRPAYQLQVICTVDEVQALEEIIFRETTATGVRRSFWVRTVLHRERVQVSTPFGRIAVKRSVLPDGSVRGKPEYEDCAAAARAAGVPLRRVFASACEAFDDRFGLEGR